MPYIPQKFSQKNLNYFFFSKKIKKNNNFSHAVNLKYKLKNGIQKSIWYTKPLGENRCEAILETLTQELYRLVHPPQPKTRRAISTETGMNEYYVLSKEIPKFKGFFLSTENYKKILNNNITGLAAIQVLALWLNEIDFKSGNVGIDKDGHIIKIDGGLSLIKLNPKFKHLYEGKNLNITQVDLEALPNLQTYEACNWLHYIHWDLQKGAIKEDPTSSDKNINRSPNFKQELYQTILRIISLPDELIRFFTKNYITNPYDITIVSEFIITRKEQLKKAAEQIPAFDEYRQSTQARKDILEFLKYLKTFKTMGKSFLINEFEDEYKINFEATLFGNAIKEYTQIVKFVINFADLTKELSTRHGEHEVRSQGARDRRALTGGAGKASRRQVICGSDCAQPRMGQYVADAGRSRPNISRVMRTNFGGTTAEIFREHSDSLAQNILLFSLQEKFKLYIESLNKIINEYFIFPTILTKEVLYETLKQIKIDLEKENLLENSAISDFFSSINNVLPPANENFKQATKPISKPQIKNTIQALPPISTFFNGNYQKISAAYHQHSTDTQSNNFTTHY